MPDPKLEEVFKLSGIPTHTFVAPLEYDKLLVALRTHGRGVVIEGPSGIGKTTAVTQALSALDLDEKVVVLSARKAEDREIIAELPRLGDIGTVIVDDFHRLDDAVRKEVADYLKTLADEEAEGTKLIIVGINKAGESLIRFAKDLVNRIDIVSFEANPPERVEMMIAQGEEALNIHIGIRESIVNDAQGSFAIAQMLCQETCLANGITEVQETRTTTQVSFEVVLSKAMDRLGGSFLPVAMSFASGTKLRREGRAPYLHMLRWLAEGEEWSIDLERTAAMYPTLKRSVNQVVEKGHLSTVLAGDPDVGAVLHFDPDTKVLGAEDPQFVFYIRHIAWRKFAERVGYLNVEFESPFDFALSFAGANRDLAARISERLIEAELAVFYDKDEEHRILAENIEDYLGPIYRSEATYVVPLMSSEYPHRIWTRFETKQFKDRFGERSIIPLWFSDLPPAAFGADREVGGIVFDASADLDSEADRIASLLVAKIRDRLVDPQIDPEQLLAEELGNAQLDIEEASVTDADSQDE